MRPKQEKRFSPRFFVPGSILEIFCLCSLVSAQAGCYSIGSRHAGSDPPPALTLTVSRNSNVETTPRVTSLLERYHAIPGGYAPIRKFLFRTAFSMSWTVHRTIFLLGGLWNFLIFS